MKEITNIETIHNILFQSLCYFDDFCRQNRLKYFLSNGTLLGAAKYNDFIPWDDDVDIMMPRDDYDKLMKLSNINTINYKLLCKEQNDKWRMPYAKLISLNTYVKEGEYNFGEEIGVSIDIFPIDKWHPCKMIALLESFRCEILKRKLVYSIGPEFKIDSNGFKNCIKKYLYKSGKKIGYNKIQEKIVYILEKSKKRKHGYSGCLAWTSHLYKEIFDFRIFEETDYLIIRNRAFPVIKDYKKYLDQMYGKWRQELPVEKQCSNHTIKAWIID